MSDSTGEIRRATAEQFAVQRYGWIGKAVVGLLLLAVGGGAAALVDWGARGVTSEAHGARIERHETRISAGEIERAEHRILLRELKGGIVDIKSMVKDLHKERCK